MESDRSRERGFSVANEQDDLRRLARLYGIQTSYTDFSGKHVEAGTDALLGVLRALEAPLECAGDVAEALRAREEELAERVVEPVVVAWDGHARDLEIRLRGPQGSLACHLDLENGERRGWVLDVDDGQRTLHALTGAVLWTFGYDTQGRLVTMTDADGNVTTVGRDGDGDGARRGEDGEEGQRPLGGLVQDEEA